MSGKSVSIPFHVKETHYAESKNFWSLLIFIFSFLLYSTAINSDYNLDDTLVTQNHRLTSKGISAIPDIFTSPYYQDEMGYSYEYRPLVLISFALEHELFGENPHVSHFFNVLLYALACSLLFIVFKKLLTGYSILFPAAISLLFAVHPIHAEVVSSIKNRDEILALIFGLLSLQSTLGFINEKKRWSIIFVPVFFTAALMCKVSILTLVFISPLLLLLFRNVLLKDYFIIVFIMTICGHFFITNMGSQFTHLVISCSIFTLGMVIFLLKNLSLITRFQKCLLKYIKDLIDTHKIDSEITLFSFSSFKNNLNIPRGLHYIVPSAILTTSFLLLFGSDQFMFSTYIVLAFPILLYLLKAEFSFWITVGFAFVLFVCTACIGGELVIDAGMLMQVFLLFSFSFKNNYRSWYFLLSILLYLSEGLFSSSGFHLSLVFPLFLIMIAFREKKWVVYLQFLILPFSLYSILFNSISNGWQTFVASTPFPLFLVLLNFKKPRKYILPILGVSIAALLSYTIIVDRPIYKSPYGIFDMPSVGNEENSQKYENLIPAGTDRPLGFTEQSIQPNDIWQVKVGTSASILLKYLQKVIIPYPLAFYYGYSEIEPTHITEPQAIAGFLLYLFLVLLALYGWFRDKILAAGLLIYLVSIAFFANLFAPVPGMFAERFLLIPSLGFCIVWVWGLGKLFKIDFTRLSDIKSIPRAAKFTFAAVLIVYSSLSFTRTFDWKNELTLFRHDIQHVPNSANAHNLLALALMESASTNPNPEEAFSQRQEAKDHFKTALNIYPDFFNVLYDLGRIYRLEDNPDSARICFEKAAELPNQFAPLYLNLADVYQQTGDTLKLLPCFETLHTLDSLNPQYLQYAFQLLIGQQRYGEALKKARKALQLTPSAPPVWAALGFAFKNLNQTDSALFYYQKHYAATGDAKTAAILNELQQTP